MYTVEIKETSGCTKKLGIEVPRERFDEEIQSALKNVKKEVQLPGFRKGKAPEGMIMKRFGDTIREEAVKDMLPKVLGEVLEQEGIEPVGEPGIVDLDIEGDGPVTFTVAVEERPEIDIDGFEGLAVTRYERPVADADVDTEIDRIRRMQSTQTEVDRPAQKNDILILDLQKLDESGVPIIGEKLENHVVFLDGQSTPSPEFDEQVIGMEKGDEKKVSFTYDETIDNEDLVGTTETYNVTVNQVLENTVPELDEEFLKSLGDFDGVDDFREKTRERLAYSADVESRRQMHSAIIGEFVKQHPFEVPNSMVEGVINNELMRLRQSNQNQDIDTNEFADRIRPDAVRAVQTFLIVDEIKNRKGFEASKEEVDEAIEKIAESNEMDKKELRRRLIKEGRLNSLKEEIVQNKVYDWLEDVVDVTVEEAPEQHESNIIQE